MSKLTLILVLFLGACASSLQGFKLRGEGPQGAWCEGTAFVIGPNRLLTAAHVYEPGMAWEVEGHPATWSFGMLADGPEGHIDLAVVQAAVGGDVAEISTADPEEPCEVLTPRGTLVGFVAGEDIYRVEPRIMHGDSGSPVVQGGKLVGVLWAMTSEEDGTSGKVITGRAIHSFFGR